MDWNWDEIQFADNVNIGVFWDKHFRQIKVSSFKLLSFNLLISFFSIGNIDLPTQKLTPKIFGDLPVSRISCNGYDILTIASWLRCCWSKTKSGSVAMGEHQKEVRAASRIHRDLQKEENEKEIGPRPKETFGWTRTGFDLRRHRTVRPNYDRNAIYHI